MSKFVQITVEVVATDKKFAEYLRRADIKSAKKGGAFVGNYEIAPDEFRKYGIVLPKGGMIIPDSEPEALKGIVQGLREAEAAQCRREQETDSAADQRIAAARERFLPKVKAIYDLLAKNAGETWRLQALQWGQEKPLGLYKADEIVCFETAQKIGLLELSPATDTALVFEWTTEDIVRLMQIVERWFEATSPRREFLWDLFVQANGIFTKTEEEKSAYAGKSFTPRRTDFGWYSEGKWDEWVEITYYVGGEKLTECEHEWLKGRSSELKVPEGYVRVNNGTNDLLRIPEIPGRGDVLVVEGKTDSHRGVWSYGEWFRGHPSKCEISFWHKGTARKIKSVILNGQVQESNWVNLNLWKDPQELAKRALQEAGVEPSKERIAALAEVYKKN